MSIEVLGCLRLALQSIPKNMFHLLYLATCSEESGPTSMISQEPFYELVHSVSSYTPCLTLKLPLARDIRYSPSHSNLEYLARLLFALLHA